MQKKKKDFEIGLCREKGENADGNLGTCVHSNCHFRSHSTSFHFNLFILFLTTVKNFLSLATTRETFSQDQNVICKVSLCPVLSQEEIIS